MQDALGRSLFVGLAVVRADQVDSCPRHRGPCLPTSGHHVQTRGNRGEVIGSAEDPAARQVDDVQSGVLVVRDQEPAAVADRLDRPRPRSRRSTFPSSSSGAGSVADSSRNSSAWERFEMRPIVPRMSTKRSGRLTGGIMVAKVL